MGKVCRPLVLSIQVSRSFTELSDSAHMFSDALVLLLVEVAVVAAAAAALLYPMGRNARVP